MILRPRSNADLDAGFTVTSLDGQPISLVGAVPWMQIRTRAGGEIIYDSDGTSHFTVNDTEGTIALTIPKAIVGTWTFQRAEFDIVLKYGTAKKPFVDGTVELNTGVTDD